MNTILEIEGLFGEDISNYGYDSETNVLRLFFDIIQSVIYTIRLPENGLYYTEITDMMGNDMRLQFGSPDGFEALIDDNNVVIYRLDQDYNKIFFTSVSRRPEDEEYDQN
jgi:hypothetical protein